MGGNINLPEDLIKRIVESITGAVPTDSIYIFGSYARGEETPDSDVDIYVLTDKDGNDRMDYEAMADVGMALLWMRRPKDVFCLSKNEFARRSRRRTGLERMVVREGVKIYERQV